MAPRRAWLVLNAWLGLVAGCDRGPRPMPPVARAPLFQRMGGIAPLRALVDELALRLAGAPELAGLYRDTDWKRYKRELLTALCATAGGPCRAVEPGPAAAPDEAAGTWLGHLERAATALEIGAAERAELIRRLRPQAARLAAGVASR